MHASASGALRQPAACRESPPPSAWPSRARGPTPAPRARQQARSPSIQPDTDYLSVSLCMRISELGAGLSGYRAERGQCGAAAWGSDGARMGRRTGWVSARPSPMLDRAGAMLDSVQRLRRVREWGKRRERPFHIFLPPVPVTLSNLSLAGVNMGWAMLDRLGEIGVLRGVSFGLSNTVPTWCLDCVSPCARPIYSVSGILSECYS